VQPLKSTPIIAYGGIALPMTNNFVTGVRDKCALLDTIFPHSSPNLFPNCNRVIMLHHWRQGMLAMGGAAGAFIVDTTFRIP
jgi:hypothetical protein